MGSDVAGEVAALGEGVTGVSLGQFVVVHPGISCGRCEQCREGRDNLCGEFKILGARVEGGYAEYVVVPADNVFAAPPNLAAEAAAALPLVFLTAWHMLVTRAGLRAGEDVLVHAAGSGIGTAAVQIAKFCGARVFATAGSDEKLERARTLGADHLINYTREDFSEVVWNLTAKRGVDVVFEHVGPDTWERSVRSLAKNGRLVTCGATSGPTAQIDLRYLYGRQLTVLGSMLGTKAELTQILRLAQRGVLKPIVDRTFPLREAAAAHRALMSRDVFGKLVLVPEH